MVARICREFGSCEKTEVLCICIFEFHIALFVLILGCRCEVFQVFCLGRWRRQEIDIECKFRDYGIQNALCPKLEKRLSCFSASLSTTPWRHVTSVLDGGDRSTSRPFALPQRKIPWYPLYRRLGGPQNRSGYYGADKNLSPAGNRTPAIQPVVCCYTDWDISALSFPLKVKLSLCYTN
jgi:hypothetical protein